ncbi:MAG: extensin family protein [Rhizobiaceae bacterium]
MRLVSALIAVVAAFACQAASAQTVPIPMPKPDRSKSGKPAQPPGPEPKAAPSDNAAVTASEPDSACEAELVKLGVRFKPSPPVNNPEIGCSIASPVELQSLPDGVLLDPPALLDCQMAVQFAEFVREKTQPIARTAFASQIKAIRHDSAYVCRTRNGTDTLSEHAFGRAVDIGSVTLGNGLIIPVMAMPKDRELEASFLTSIRSAACGPFTTVLGPGSDADHALHFHFDRAPRKSGPYCR